MVTVAPLARRHSFIPERILTHAEELAYLWQRRRYALRSSQLTQRDFAFLVERIEAHLQGLLIAGESLAGILGEALTGDDRDEVFSASWALLRSGQPALVRRVLEAFATAKGAALAGFTDALATTSCIHTEATLRAALAHGSAEHSAVAALALANQRRLDPASEHLLPLLIHDKPEVAERAWRAVLHLDPGVPAPRRPFAEALRHPSADVRRAVLEAAVWRGEPWVPDAVRRLAAEGDADGLGWYAALSEGEEQEAVLDLIGTLGSESRVHLCTRLARPHSLVALLEWMEDADPVLAAAAAQGWTRMSGLSVDGERREVANPDDEDFPLELWLPDLAKAKCQWADKGQDWLAGGRWCQGFDIQVTMSSEAQSRIDLESRWDFGARAALSGVWVFAPPPSV